MDLTDRQAADRINRTLNAIWRLGDRDECSIKHVGHSTAALMNGATWTEAVDYRRPWNRGDETPRKEKKLAESWAKIEAIRDQIGTGRFQTIVEDVPIAAAYAPIYNADYWRK